MDLDVDKLLIGLGIVLVVVVLKLLSNLVRGIGHRARVTEAEREEIRRLVEERLAALLSEFPRMSDEEVATLLRDELENERCKDMRFFHYATAHTAGHIRRTAVVAALREGRESD